MVCKENGKDLICKKFYTIIEYYPSVLNHRIPIVHIIIYIIYKILFISYYIYELIKDIKSKKWNLLKIITFPKDFYKKNFSKKDKLTINNKYIPEDFLEEIENNSNLIKIKVSFKKNKESVLIIEDLINKSIIDNSLKEFLPKKNNFFLKEETLFLKKDIKEVPDYLLFKGYNKPTLIILNILKKLRIKEL